MEDRTLICEASREEEEGDEQGEEAQRTSISHALSPGASGLRRHCTGVESGPRPRHRRRRSPFHQLHIGTMRTARKGGVEMPAFMRQLVKETEKRVGSFFKVGRGGAAGGEQPGDGEKEEVFTSPYLDRPVLDKLTEEGCARWGLTYALGSMQGWRANMEDFHNCIPQLRGELGEWSFFAVFDGHAGSTVAQYCSQHLLGHILATGEGLEHPVMCWRGKSF